MMRGFFKQKRGAWLLQYTLMYLCIAMPMVLCLLLSGKTYFWGMDAYNQQYTTLCYTGSVLRRLISGGGFSMVELSLGQGMDSIGTLGYYGLTDPMQWLGLFFTGDALEAYYHFLVFLYIYLAGLFFCIYARKNLIPGAAQWQQALSGIIFTTCGYQTIGVIKNPYYAAGGIYLVLMLIAVERIFRQRKWVMMSIVTLLMLMANFYLAYQTTLLTIIYIIIRLAFRLKKRGVKEAAGDGFVLLGAYILGFALSMVFLLPSALNFLNSGRVDVAAGYTDSLLHYPWAYYLKLAALFAAPYDYAGYWALQSFCPLALFAVMLLFAPAEKHALDPDRERRAMLRTGMIVLLACICVPLAGKIFNGLGYVTNRWSYGYALMVCMVTAWALPRMLDGDFAGRKKLAWAGLVWAALMLAYGLVADRIPAFEGGSNLEAVSDYGVGTKNVAGILGAVAVAASALCILLLDKKLKLQREKAVRIFAVLTVLCCFVYSFGYTVVAATSVEFKEKGITRQIENQTVAATRAIEDDGFYRVDAGTGTDSHAPILGYHGTSYYWSMIPEWVSAHYTGLELSTQQWLFRLDGLGADTYLNGLASVKYSLRRESDAPMSLPYGYELMDVVDQDDGDRVRIYRNAYALPIGYVFDEVMSAGDYAALDPVSKRNALVSCAVLEDADCGLDAFAGTFDVESLDWEVAAANGVEIGENELLGSEGGTITLRFEARADAEAYLRLDGVELLSANSDTDLRIECLTADGANGMYIILPGGNFNYNQKGACMRLGYDENGLTECVLRFADDGVLQYDALEILSVPVQGYRTAVEEIRSRGLWDVVPGDDCVAGAISLQNPGILQVSLPYSEGWTAFVDGAEAQILRCGGMYMGVRLDAGEYMVELRYETPGLRIGAWVSLGALVVLAALCLLQRKRACKY